MSDHSIYIALHGTTSNVPPRYTGLGSARARDPRSPTIWCGIPDLPYAIRNSEFGNRDSGTGVQEIFMVRYFPS